MKILAISFLFPNTCKPAAGIFVLNRLKHIDVHCDIKVINPIPWFPFSFLFDRYRHFSLVPKKEIIEGLDVYHPRFFIIPKFLKFIDSITFAMAVLPLAFRLKKKYDFDLIDLHWTYPDLLTGRLLSVMTSKKQLVTIRGKEALCLNEKTLRAQILKYCLVRSNKVITLSDELKADVMCLGVAEDAVQTIRNGVDYGTFRYKNKKNSRELLNLPRDCFIVLSVGSLIFRKGHDRVIKNFKLLLNTRPDAYLYIIGSEGPEGDFRKELIQLVQDLSIEKHVCFIGQVKNEDLIFWYTSADMFCLLSRGEGSPNVLSEALACGTPCVATQVGSVSEILDSSLMGQVAPNEDSQIFSSFLEVANQAYNRKNIAERMKSYGWDWCAQNVVNIYKGLLNKE